MNPFAKLFTAGIGTIAAIVFISGSAWAVPITAGSTLSLQGQATHTATSITFTNPANVGASSGDFVAIGTCIACVTMTDLSTVTPLPVLVYTAISGATSTFTLDNIVFSGNLTISGTGTATLTGFDPTPGTFDLTSQGPAGVLVTFSSTTVASAVPEPATLALLGVGLLGLGVMSRRRRAS